MEHPDISVVVCTYNRCEYLGRCLSSLKGQTYRRFEIIVVNGPSTDGTADVLEAHPDITIVRQRSLNGLSYARNLGISAARGDVVAFIDDDAVADRRWLEYLAEDYADDAVGCAGGLVLGRGGTHTQFDNGTIRSWGIPGFHREEGASLKKHEYQVCMGTNTSFRRDVLHKLDGFDPHFRYYHDESDLCVRVARAGYKVTYDRRAVVTHDMVEGFNRKSTFDMNWVEIIGNVIFFTMKNFRGDARAFTVWPLRALLHWLIYFLDWTLKGQIAPGLLVRIYGRVVRGAARGYLLGLKGPRPGKNLITIPPVGEGRIRICFLSKEYSRDCRGGICRYTYDLAHGLAAAGNEVHVVTLSGRGDDYDTADADVIVHHVVPQPVDGVSLPLNMPISKANLAYSHAACLKLLDLIEERGIEIVEAPLWDAEAFAFSLLRDRVPLVVRLETPLFKVAEIQRWKITKDLKLANWMEGEAIRNADRAIAISGNIGELIGGHHGIPADGISVCPLGIEVPVLGLPGEQTGRHRVLFVGRIETRKGVDTLFQAIPAVVSAVPDVSFTIAGSDTDQAPGGGSYKKYLLDHLDRKYHSNVRFIGYLDGDSLDDSYLHCDVVVAPSLYESFGLIYLEAMARGKPVIGCRVGGVPEVVADGKTGILVSPGDPSALAAAMVRILTDSTLMAEMGAEARRWVESQFSSKAMTEASLKQYREIILQRGGGDNGRGRN